MDPDIYIHIYISIIILIMIMKIYSNCNCARIHARVGSKLVLINKLKIWYPGTYNIIIIVIIQYNIYI